MNAILMPNIIIKKDISIIGNRKLDIKLNTKINEITKKSHMYPEKFSTARICAFTKHNEVIYTKDMVESEINEIWTLYVNVDDVSYVIKDCKTYNTYELKPLNGLLLNEYDNISYSFQDVPQNGIILVKKMY